MYSYGLETFIQSKKLNSKEAINKFLEQEKITEFTAKNHNRVNNYIQNNWVKFATFIDKGIKSGLLKGKAIKLNYYFDEQREFKNNCKEEIKLITKEEMQLITLINKYDDLIHLSRTSSFFGRKNMKMPSNQEGFSRKYKILPKIQFILNSKFKEEYICFLKNKINIEE
jgi:hypothetical protein